ncbi:MAG TPA: FlgD immunoglobulin-like domain containing protein, partial [Gemmatimonadaceae bacterium]|nr:FlgD immunoglobulin-like domain containing protein [Gemmatimonadaceae bacterium]
GTLTAAGTSYFRIGVSDVNGRSGSRSFAITVFAAPPQSQVAATADQCFTPSHGVVTSQVTYTRGESTPVRAVSVTLQLDPAKLALATPGSPTSSIHLGSWLAGYGNSSLLVTDNGGGSYTADVTLLGAPCGITSGGQLLTLDLAAPGGDGTGTIQVIAVHARDCSNVPVAVGAGPAGVVTIDRQGPAPVTNLAATQITSGNASGDTTGIQITWTGGSGDQLALYRAPYGTYPLYTDAGAPPDSTLLPGAPWVLVTANPSSGLIDRPALRGVWDYILLVTDSCGVALQSNRTPGTLDYFLGDVSDGLTQGHGNNRVLSEDVSLLGAHYGITGAGLVNPVGYLDVGPTADGTPHSRPLPDHQLDFEDLVIFAQNYAVPTTPGAIAHRAGSGGSERFTVSAPSLVEAGQEFDVPLTLSGAGSLQGFSARLAWDPAVVVPEQMHSLGFIEGQGGVVLSGSPGMIDAALLGTRASGIAGDGEVARVHFRALRAGIAAIELKSVDGRDAANRHVSALELKSEQRLPTETVLLAPAPNPTSGRAELAYTLARSGEVELAIYAVDGRRVRTLASGQRPAGIYRLSWDARDGQGRSLPAGMYFLRLDAAGRRCSRSIALVR